MLHSWREKQRQGESLEFKPEQVKNLIARVENIESGWPIRRRTDARSSSRSDALKAALQQLLIADVEIFEPSDTPAEDQSRPAAEIAGRRSVRQRMRCSSPTPNFAISSATCSAALTGRG